MTFILNYSFHMSIDMSPMKLLRHIFAKKCCISLFFVPVNFVIHVMCDIPYVYGPALEMLSLVINYLKL